MRFEEFAGVEHERREIRKAINVFGKEDGDEKAFQIIDLTKRKASKRQRHKVNSLPYHFL
jgi:hypothetical protein